MNRTGAAPPTSPAGCGDLRTEAIEATMPDAVVGAERDGRTTMRRRALRNRMKAIVLTYDRNHPLTEHMVRTYQDKWPDHPFVFRVPYQGDVTKLRKRLGRAIEPIQTPPNIKGTVLRLTQDLADSEWVYWCIDDKYLVDIDVQAANETYHWISSITDPKVQGAMFCRTRRLLEPDNIRSVPPVDVSSHYRFLTRKNYYQCWIHQFMTVGVLRRLFESFPDDGFVAKEMDTFTGQVDGELVRDFGMDETMYVSEKNYARFGESSHAGRITRNCRSSMQAYGVELPVGAEFDDRDIYMGEMDS